ncbi:MAG: D-aminoacyl-tRNA deacylase [Halovenus sp.]|jgi:D-aminoacyl-tRNA deacylase
MLGIVVSRADSASVHIGEQLLEVADWERHEDDTRSDAAGGGTVYRADGVSLREFEALHLDLERPAEVFEAPTLLVFASRHSGETGQLLTAHHTGNAGAADYGGEPCAFARACPNAHARVLAALADHAPEGYDVGMECTHHGPTAVGAPSMFVEVGSSQPEWDDPAAARAVARAILDLRDVPPDRPGEDRSRRQLVGLGGGHYAPRFERVVRETDWAVGHLLADWGLTALDEAATDDRESTRRAVLDRVFQESKAAYALVDGDRPGLEATVADLGYRPVGETWVRETSGVDLGFARAVERAVTTVAEGLRFGVAAPGTDERVRGGWTVETLPRDLLDEAFGIDREQTRAAVADTALAFETAEGGTRPTETVVLSEASDRERIVERLVDVLGTRYDSLERRNGALLAREEVFDPDLARTLGVPEGPAFGRLSGGQPVEVDGETIPPGAVTRERERQFSLR